MKRLQELFRRASWLFRRSRFRTELADELEFHLMSRAEELTRKGMTKKEALTAARWEFGSPLRAAENTFEAWEFHWLSDLWSDLQYAAKSLRRNPGLALTAVFCLALGTGANSTIFNFATSFLFSQPSARDVASLIAIREGGTSVSSIADYNFLGDSHIFSGVAGINPERELNWQHAGATSRLYAGLVTGDYFSTLGVPMLLGRGIAPGENDTAVLSYRCWRGSLNGDPAAIGRKLVLDGRAYQVAGVLPADHRSIVGFGFSPDVYTPVIHDDDSVSFYARMPQGMTMAIAHARLRQVFAQLDRIQPKEGWKRANEIRVTAATGPEQLGQLFGPVLAFFSVLMIVAGLVLLVACTNVASLLLARAASRSQELAIRVSLGATRLRLVRHLLAESLLLAILGAIAGWQINLFCGWLIDRVNFPLPVPIHPVISSDRRLLWYSLV